MQKKLKFIFSFLILFIILLISKKVNANSISSISMDIYVDDNGDAQITEIWDCYTDTGTEVYHPYYNLGKSVISDLSVVDGSTTYNSLDSWNTSGTLSSKAYQCGINEISNGVELCWGISSYGNHIYTISYKISDFVAELTDSQMIYWTLIPYDFSNNIGRVFITLHTNFDIPDSTDVWGYGNYGGTCYVYNGCIEMESDGSLLASEYMTLLAKFPSGTFNVKDNSLNNDFNYYLNMANDGATSYQKAGKIERFFSELFNLFFVIFPFAIVIFTFAYSIISSKQISIGIDKETKHAVKNAPYFRDIPCNGDLYLAYYVANKYRLSKRNTDLLGAIILKWLRDGLIKIEKQESGAIIKKENSVIVLNNTYSYTPNKQPSAYEQDIIIQERKLYNMIYEASKDGILENKEFEKWCSKHYEKILNWFDKILDIVEKSLIANGVIISEQTKTLGIFTTTKLTATPELSNKAVELSGLKKYLNDYTLIADRESIEVALFENYLIYAQILGIADKVAKEFRELYPTIIQDSNFYSYDYIFFVNSCSYNGISHASSAKAKAESYSSGGGGFSSGGGGGGSFGGGGGGGGFR